MRQEIGAIQIEDYNYKLPAERIAKFPLRERDQSKLLYCKQDRISEKKFSQIPDLLPPDSLLIFNETKVIRARLIFHKPTGAQIEIFCLEPVKPSNDFQIAFQQGSSVVWKCLVGNAKRWKEGELATELDNNGQNIQLKARVVEKLSDSFLIEFSWDPTSITFSEIIEMNGLVPLPPYLNREAVESDKTRYQTIYAKYDGSVAAPTAGLHFTDSIITKIENIGVESDKVTLHVGAGTFRPVVSSTIANHNMHSEKIVVGMAMLKHLHQKINEPIIPVGTTSMRTLESFYWLALNIQNGNYTMQVEQWDPYKLKSDFNFTPMKAIEVLIEYLEINNLDQLKAETRLMIAPGYQFKFATGLITNFHQPKSTLLLLVSAMIGDGWKTAYDFALNNDFRFLSYGDSCLFLP